MPIFFTLLSEKIGMCLKFTERFVLTYGGVFLSCGEVYPDGTTRPSYINLYGHLYSFSIKHTLLRCCGSLSWHWPWFVSQLVCNGLKLFLATSLYKIGRVQIENTIFVVRNISGPTALQALAQSTSNVRIVQGDLTEYKTLQVSFHEYVCMLLLRHPCRLLLSKLEPKRAALWTV